jgi:hypothetical protein
MFFLPNVFRIQSAEYRDDFVPRFDLVLLGEVRVKRKFHEMCRSYGGDSRRDGKVFLLAVVVVVPGRIEIFGAHRVDEHVSARKEGLRAVEIVGAREYNNGVKVVVVFLDGRNSTGGSNIWRRSGDEASSKEEGADS